MFSIARRTVTSEEDTSTSLESTEVTRFDSNQAFIFLFAVSFGPAFIVVDLTTAENSGGSNGLYIVNSILVVFILLVFVSNAISVAMLTSVQSQTKLSSYQEVAYWISKGNRGYIFLISIMKVVYLVTCCAYCMQFIANYATVLTEVLLGYCGVDFSGLSAYGIWGIYVGWLTVVGTVAYLFYQRQNSHEQILAQAYILFYCVIVSVMLLIIFLAFCFIGSYKRWLF